MLRVGEVGKQSVLQNSWYSYSTFYDNENLRLLTYKLKIKSRNKKINKFPKTHLV